MNGDAQDPKKSKTRKRKFGQAEEKKSRTNLIIESSRR